MAKKLYTLIELFENDAFIKFGHYFLEQTRTTVEVEDLSDVSRQTISSIVKKFLKTKEGKYKYIEWDMGKKGKPFRLKPDILIDYVGIRFKLAETEIKALNELLSNEGVLNYLSGNNVNIAMAAMKAIDLILSLCTINQISIDDPKYEERAIYLGKAINNALKKAPEYYLADVKRAAENIVHAPFGLDNIRTPQAYEWRKKYVKANSRLLESILPKMLISNLPIILSISDLYDIYLQRVGGVLYINRQKELGSESWSKQQLEFIRAIKDKGKAKTKSDVK